MTERKGTPDILGEMLGGGSGPTPEPDFEITSSPTPPPARPKKPATPRKTASSKPVSQKTTSPTALHWQYQVVSLQHKDGWRPRYINGLKVKNWESGPQVHEFLELMDNDGWELVSATSSSKLYGETDGLQLYFRRTPGKG
jgi:hypothetical protein